MHGSAIWGHHPRQVAFARTCPQRELHDCRCNGTIDSNTLKELSVGMITKPPFLCDTISTGRQPCMQMASWHVCRDETPDGDKVGIIRTIEIARGAWTFLQMQAELRLHVALDKIMFDGLQPCMSHILSISHAASWVVTAEPIEPPWWRKPEGYFTRKITIN